MGDMDETQGGTPGDPLEPGRRSPEGPLDQDQMAENPDGRHALRKPRPDIEVVKAARSRRRKSYRIALAIGAVMLLCVVAAAIADSVLSARLRRMYSEQPWVRIARAYREIDEGAVLSIHREAAVARLDREFLNREGWVIGFVTAVGEPRDTDAGIRVRVLVDVPNFAEVVNLFEDDVRVELDPSMAGGVKPGTMVIAKGAIDNYSRWGVWMSASYFRPLNAVEKHYVWKVVPPTSHMREPMGFDALARKK